MKRKYVDNSPTYPLDAFNVIFVLESDNLNDMVESLYARNIQYTIWQPNMQPYSRLNSHFHAYISAHGLRMIHITLIIGAELMN